MVSITRGDTKEIRFQRIDKATQEPIIEKPNEMYLTIKSSYKDKDYVIQKRLSNGTITFNEDDSFYYVTLSSTDTDKLNFGEYDFDIEVVDSGSKKTIYIDKIMINKEVTWAENEV